MIPGYIGSQRVFGMPVHHWAILAKMPQLERPYSSIKE